MRGTLKKHADGFGFVQREDGDGEDIYLPARELETALDGDLLRVEIVQGTGGRSAGRLVEIMERRRTHFLGVYQLRGRGAVVVPVDRTLPPVMPVPVFAGARDGQLVKAVLVGDVRTGLPPEAEVQASLEGATSADVETLTAIYAQGFSDVFPAEVIAASEAFADHVTAEDRAGRRDLRETPLVTIDGEDARDFDDAIHVEHQGSGYRLLVAIADVAHYVREGQPLDTEALRRGTSVYFPDRAVPMLPERLSNGLCSLKPDVERLCLVCEIRLDRSGKPTSTEIYPGVMKSAARCTYTQVAALLGGEAVPALAHVASMLGLAHELAGHLSRVRTARGSIDFDLPESYIVVDGKGGVADIRRRARNDAHRLIEELMLAANEAVARTFAEKDTPTVYRVHAAPDEERLSAFTALAAAHGHVTSDKGVRTSGELNALLRQLAGRPEERALNQLLLRAMMQAQYSPENVGHFGLAASHYLHFTSPIRRYPDLMVHRLLYESWKRGGMRGPSEEQTERLASVAAQSSARERAAMTAERDVAGFYAALLMTRHLGEKFPGIVSSVQERGFFVELDAPFVEGYVRAEEVGGSFKLDEVARRLVFGSGLSFALGDKVTVEVASSSPRQRKVDFKLVEPQPARVQTTSERPRKRAPGRRG